MKKKTKILLLLFSLSLLVCLIPLSSVLAWTAPTNVTINNAQHVSYFTSASGSAMETGFYYVAGTNEVAYCVDAEGDGPGGTSYTLNDGALTNSAYLSGIQAIIQNGYPYNTNSGLSSEDARYATQVAIHWIENYYLGGSNGYDYTVRANTDANGHDGALALALSLFDIGVNQAQIRPDVAIAFPTAWTNVNGVLQCTVFVDEENTDYWEITALPAGVASMSGTSFTGDVNITLQMTDISAYTASSKIISVLGYTNKDTSNIHLFTASGTFQTMVCVSTQTNGLDPSARALEDAQPNVTLLKLGQDTGAGLPGASILIWNNAANAGDWTKGWVAGSTDSSGMFTLENVADGTYYWCETSAPSGYKLDTTVRSFTVTGGIVSGTTSMTDEVSTVTLLKLSAETGAGLPGAGILIWNNAANAGDWTKGWVAGTTDSSGMFTLENVADGTYYWCETNAPSGYKLDTTVRSFTVTGGIVSGTTSMTDEVSTVTLLKLSAETGAGLPGAGILIWNNAANAGDWTKGWVAGTTDSSGMFTFSHIPDGTYYWCETSAPYGYVVDTTVRSFTVSGGTVSGTTSMTDARQKVSLMLTKEKEDAVWNEETKAYEWGTVSAQGITFDVYAAADITDLFGNVMYAKDTLVDTITTNEKGIATTDADLYYGTYYAVETAVTDDVVQDDTHYEIEVTQAEQASQTAVYAFLDGQPIVNQKIAGTMEIYKQAADTKLPMTGVVFEVYDKDANLIDTITTDSEGKAKTKVLPYGTYTLIETKSNTGYTLSEKISFSISLTPAEGSMYSEDSMTVEDQKMATIEVYKVTADSQTPMDGVVFGVYDAKTQKEVGRITTGKDGHGVVYMLPGSYYLQEISTWPGYAVSTDQFEVTDAQFATIYTFRTSNAMTALRVTKKSTNGQLLPNMEFTVTDNASGKLISFVLDPVSGEYIEASLAGAEGSTVCKTDANGTASLRGLVMGTYTIREITAPIGYNLDSEDTTATIGLTTTGVLGATVDLTDSPIVTKTGETSNPAHQIVGIALVVVACMFAAAVFIRQLRINLHRSCKK